MSEVMENEFCLCCRRSLSRLGGRSQRRSYSLTAEFVQSHPRLMAYLVEIAIIDQFHERNKICRPCYQRSQRYYDDGQDHVQADPVMPLDAVVLEEDAHDLPMDAAPNQPVVGAADQPIDAVPNQPVQYAANQIMDPAPDPPVEDAANQRNVQDQAVQTNIPYNIISLPGYSRAPYNTHTCIIAGCNNRDLRRIHVDIRALILQQKCFYIPRGNRICEEHSFDSVWQDIEVYTRRILNVFSPAHIKEMMDILRKRKVFLNFDRPSLINDAVFHYFIGYTKLQFQEILRSTPRISRRHKKKAGTALATVLAKLRTGESNQRLANIFGMARTTLEKTMRLVRSDLLAEFVPRYLGFDHMTREEVISRCTSIPNALFGNPDAPPSERRAIVILDGTYIYLQKSSNYYFQRKSYSLHKFRHLLKPFLIVCPDGHILDIYGLYAATESDATILSNIVKSHDDPFNWFFRENYVLILDRGFRNCIEDLESCGYRAYMPSSKDENERQLTEEQANESRKVTMCRWVVETINGRLKNQFRQLRIQNFNIAAGHLFEEVKIAGALLNAFGAPYVDSRLVDDIIRRIPMVDGNRNRLSEYVLSNNLNRRRADFQPMNAAIPEMDDFPVLSADELIIYALGTYQIAQARSYYGEHIKNGSYIIELYKETSITDFRNRNLDTIDPWLLRGRIQSRHTSARTYYVYILLERELQGLDALLGHYCSCVVGKRTIGCCSHVMSVIWFMGWGRYQENLTPPALFLDTIIREDMENEVHDEADDN